MSVLGELELLGRGIGADVERFVSEGKQELEKHVLEDPQPLFDVLREVKPVLMIHDTAIVTRYRDVVEVLTNDESFGVQPYLAKMQSLAGDFILCLNDCAEYERDISILRLAAPRSDIPKLSEFVSETAEGLVEEAMRSTGSIDVAELSKQVPARLLERWFGLPEGEESSLTAWTLAMFEDIFVNLKNDPEIHEAAMKASAQLRPYLERALAEHKGGSDEDVIGRLLAMRSTAAVAFSDEEITTNLIGLATGFIPTVATATTFALNALLDRPQALAGAQEAVLAGEDEALRTYMWEAMRLEPQGPGLLRRTLTSFTVAPGTMHATTIPEGTLTFASTQSAMLDGSVIAEPMAFRTNRPAREYLHFGAGLHECFGRFANAMQIPLIGKALLRHPNLRRAAGAAGTLVKAGPYPQSLLVTFDQ